jgi:ABC-type transporter Mla maintaining outer membrane lipid asymmetry ATPase subunit MlaF
LQRLAGECSPEVRARAHLARAVALDPALLVLEHPTAALPEPARAAYAAAVARVADARRLAVLVLTRDEPLAHAIAHRALKFNPATGALTPLKRGWFK